MRLLEELDRRDNKPRLHVVGSSNRRIVGCKWGDLVLDYKVRTMLKDDFESFFERQTWFRENKLPFRRGYLLHGPPGCGKTSAIRAMMTSRALTAYTVRFFDAQVDDSDLDHLFELAVKNRPSMVLLEDLDSAFPKTGESKSRISLQQLLNNLDGVGTGEGIVVVATANEPTILDPAILRRPGRFDRVVHFPNPSAELRQQYLQQLNPSLPARHLKLSVEDSEGFSFAQLREVHVIAGQRAFERKGEIGEGDLLMGIRALRQSNVTASRNGTAAGFCSRQEISA
jgi:ATP-dependent 26S proteasome regulatory subunit